VAGVLALMVGKALCIYLVARFAKSPHAEAMDRAILMAQGGEFAFVLFTEALKLRVMDAEVNANMTAIVVLSMALTPLVVVLYKRWARADALSLDGVEAPQDLQGNVLIIGFGRVGQIASQGPLAKGCSCPSSTTTRTPSARRRCMASRSITATVRGRTSCMRQGQARPGHRRLRGRQGRGHPHRGERAARMPACANGGAGLRPGTCAGAGAPGCRPCGARDLESAMVMARQTLKVIGVDDGEADLLLEQVRSRDAERFALETAGGMFAGRALVLGNIEHIAPPRHDDEARKQG
jgi:glutathione-regulated potassium-efflux system ancillary protein KefC/glutathione-regulated potassium-efflux system protein KefB